MRKTPIIAALLTLSAVALLPGTLFAQEQEASTQQLSTQESSTQQSSTRPPRKKLGDFTIAPSTPNIKSPNAIYLELKPGSTHQDSIIIENKNDHAITLFLYPADRKFVNGQYEIKTNKERQELIGWWIQLAQYDITLGAGEKKVVDYTIKIPDYVPTGEYIGAITATLPAAPNSGMIAYSIRYALGAKIIVTDNPQYIPKVGETNVFASTTPYFWVSLALFILGITYFIYGTLTERKKKKQLSSRS